VTWRQLHSKNVKQFGMYTVTGIRRVYSPTEETGTHWMFISNHDQARTMWTSKSPASHRPSCYNSKKDEISNDKRRIKRTPRRRTRGPPAAQCTLVNKRPSNGQYRRFWLGVGYRASRFGIRCSVFVGRASDGERRA